MKQHRVPKPLLQKVSDLDDHLFILRENVRTLATDVAFLKIIASELRVLICHSSGTEGLLWRLVDDLHISDRVALCVVGETPELDPDNAVSHGSVIIFAPALRPSFAPPMFPRNDWSLRHVIKEMYPVYVRQTGITHEQLIKAVAEQMGGAHEDDGLEPRLAFLSDLFLNGLPPYVPVLAFDAELCLQIGERVLRFAEKDVGYKRKPRSGYPDELAIVMRVARKEPLGGRCKLFTARFETVEVEAYAVIGPASISFFLEQKGNLVAELSAAYEHDSGEWRSTVFAMTHSNAKRNVTIAASYLKEPVEGPSDVFLLDACGLRFDRNRDSDPFVAVQYLGLWHRSFSLNDCADLASLSIPELYASAGVSGYLLKS